MLYLDTSAFLKLLVEEGHSGELRSALEGESLWSSSLLDVEAHRAARRLGVDVGIVADLLDTVTIVAIGAQTMIRARDVGLDTLRTLDALHLASALELVPDLEAVVTYDRRLAAGCDAEGCAVRTPGRPDNWWTSERDD